MDAERLADFKLIQFRGSVHDRPQVLLDGHLLRDSCYQNIPGSEGRNKPCRLFLHEATRRVVIWFCMTTEGGWTLRSVVSADRFHNLEHATAVGKVELGSTHEVKLLAGNGTWRTETFRFINLPGEDKQEAARNLMQVGDVSFCDMLERKDHNGRGAQIVLSRMTVETIKALGLDDQ